VIPLRDWARVVYHPHGVVGIIGAYNYPLVLTMGDAIPALLAGNAVVLKPSELVPLTAELGRQKLIKAGLDPDLLQITHGSGPAGAALVNHADFVMFTGSVETGRRVATAAARRLVPFNVELGGKNALIILEDAHLRHAVTATIDGAFGNAGQICLCWERIYVHEAIWDAYLDLLLHETGRLRLSDSAGQPADMGVIIDARHVEKIAEHVSDAVSKGATVLYGGRLRDDISPTFFEPTILAAVTPDMLVHTEETFGPVIALYRVSSEDEAIRLANDTDTGLNFGVFTRSRRRGERVARRLQAGAVAVNDTAYYTWGAMGAPLGGFKQSGTGRRHGPEGIRQYTQAQMILINRTNTAIGSPATAMAMSPFLERLLTLALRLWRHIPLIR
jgi:succinate-semialdehyde dehydrogenase/glutarate-semialdehyde dehydrogenase